MWLAEKERRIGKGKEGEKEREGEREREKANTWSVTPRQGERATGLALALLCTFALRQEAF